MDYTFCTLQKQAPEHHLYLYVPKQHLSLYILNISPNKSLHFLFPRSLCCNLNLYFAGRFHSIDKVHVSLYSTSSFLIIFSVITSFILKITFHPQHGFFYGAYLLELLCDTTLHVFTAYVFFIIKVDVICPVIISPGTCYSKLKGILHLFRFG
jgi:hypothetical protein